MADFLITHSEEILHQVESLEGVGVIFAPGLFSVSRLSYPPNPIYSATATHEGLSVFVVKETLEGDELLLFQEQQIALHREKAIAATSQQGTPSIAMYC